MAGVDELIREIDEQALPGKVLSRDVPLTGSPRFITFAGIYGNQFDRYTNPDSISFETYNQMRFHGLIRAGLKLIKAPILASFQKATVECKDPKIKRVVEHQFIDSGLLYQLAKSSLSAVDFGVAFHEKVWDTEDVELTYEDKDPDTGESFEDVAWSSAEQGPLHVYTEIRDVNPVTVRFIMRDPDTRRFSGFVQSWAPTWISTGGKPPLTPEEIAKLLPKGMEAGGIDGMPILAQKAFVYTYEKEFGNMWGTPRLRAVYPYYFWIQVFLKYWMAWGERKIVPTRIVRHPVGRAADGTDYSDLAVFLANAIDDVTSVAVPNTRMSEPGSAWHGGDFQWHFEEVTTTDKAETFKLIIDYLESGALRAMFVPERTFTSGQGFSLYSTDAAAHTDTFLMTEDADAGDLVNAINADAVKPFVLTNFGPDAEQATIHVPGLTDAHKEMLREILTSILTQPEVVNMLDIEAILDQLGVPMHDADDQAAAAAQQQGAAAPQAGPTPPNAPQPSGTPVDNAAGAQPPGIASGAVPAETPANLVLSDEPISLDTFDPSRWDVSPDPKALNGYRVVDKGTGQRITGFAAQQVVVAFQKYSSSQAKKGAAAQKTAANKAASAQKAADRKAAAEQAKAQRQLVAAQKKEAAATTRAEKQQAAKEKRDAAARLHAAKQAAAAQTKQQKQAATAAKQQQHQQATAAKQQQRATSQQQSAVNSAVKSERNTLQAQTAKLPAAQGVDLLKQNGFQVTTVADAASHDALVQQATKLATAHPDRVYTLVKVGGGEALASKPVAAVESGLGAQGGKAHAANVALEDDEGYGAGTVSTMLLERFAGRIAGRLRRKAS